MLDDDTKTNAVSAAFYDHPLIKYLGENKFHSEPAYMTAQNFSKVLVDLLRGKNVQPGQDFAAMIQNSLNAGKTQWGAATIEAQSLSYIRSLWADSQNDVERFRILLEQWFDDTMERASGWYKRKTQLILLIIGMSMAIAFNVDSIAIAKKLSNDPKLAAQFASNAAVYVQTHKELAEQLKNTPPADTARQNELGQQMKLILDKSKHLMDSANAMVSGNITDANELLGLGWSDKCKKGKAAVCLNHTFHWYSIIGWIITALAISLGAPFWFDLLNKLMKLRSSVASSPSDDKQKQQETKTPK
jgi:hypothetical protein